MNYQERHWDIIDDQKASENPYQWVTLAAGFKTLDGIDLQFNTRMKFHEGERIYLRVNTFKKNDAQPDFVLIAQRNTLEIDPNTEVVSPRLGGQ